MSLRPRWSPLALVLSLLASLSLATARADQSGTLELDLSRDFGYSSFSGQIQGTFSLHATGPADLFRVDFLIDSQILGEVTHPPFAWQFSTDRFPPGEHSLSAVGYTSAGQELRSRVIQAEFVTASQAAKGVVNIVFPILVVILLAVVGSALFPVLLNRGKKAPFPPGSQRNYGLRGGAICPNCHRPFALSLLSPHLVVLQLARCPYCGRLGFVRRGSTEELRQAEAAEKESATLAAQPPEETEEEKLHRELEESRYRES